MDTEDEKIEYSFTGDVTSLQKAVTEAVSLLGKFEKAVKTSASKGDYQFKGNLAKDFKQQFSSMYKDLGRMRNELRGFNTQKINIPVASENALKVAVSDISNVLNILNTKTNLTGRNIRQMSRELTKASSTMMLSSQAVDQLAIRQAFLNATNEQMALSTRNMAATLGVSFDGIKQKLISMVENYKAMSKALSESAKNASTELPPMANQLALVAAKVSENTTTAGSAGGALQNLGSRFITLSKAVIPLLQHIPKFSKLLALLTLAMKLNTLITKKLISLFLKVVSVVGRLLGKIKALVAKFAQLHKNISSTSSALSKFATVAIGTQLVRALASAIKSSLDYTETLNLFRVAMGESIDEGTDFINKMQEIYGLDPHTLMKSAGMFNELASAIGAPADAAKNMSLSLTKASVDISSLFNVPVEKVAADLASGMQGMSRTVRKYGMDIRMTTIEQTALSLGLQLQAETTTEANRQGLRYITMMRQAFDATGDFARTITSPANQLRILKEQLQQAGRAIGSFFYEPLRLVLPYINGFVMALRVLIETLAAFAGYKADEFDVSDTFDRDETAIGGVGDAAEDTAKAMKKLMAPFDELNVLSEQANMGGGGGGILSDELMDPAIVAAIDAMKIKFDDIKLKANEVRDAILKFFGFDYVSVINIDTGAFEKKLNVIKGGFADNLIKAIKGDDPEGVSNAVAEVTQRLVTAGNNLVLSFQTMVSWENLGSGIKLALAGITSAINTVFDPGHGIDFGSIGASIGTLVNTISATLLTWFQSINFSAIASAFTHGVRVMIEKVDWINIGATIAAWFNSIIAYWGTLIATAPWIEIGASIATSLNKIIEDLDWLSVGRMIGNLFAGVISMVGTFVKTMNWGDLYKGIMTALKAMGWGEIGKNIAELFNNTLKTIDWEAVGRTINGMITWFIDQVVLFFKTTDWVKVGEAFADMLLGINWREIIGRLWSLLKAIISGAIGLILGFIKGTVLDPIVSAFSDAWGGIVTGFTTAWAALKEVMGKITGWVKTNVTDPLTRGFKTVINGLISGVESFINFFITGLNHLINMINSLSFTIPGLMGLPDIHVGFNLQPVTPVALPRLPMAKGGVVTGPTNATIGEGKYDEAVIPLGSSPQLKELVNQIATAVHADPNRGGGTSTDNIIVQVQIGGKDYDAFTYKAARRGEKLVGAQPITIGG